MRDLALENPIRAIREIAQDMTGQRKIQLANGREMSVLEIQSEYFAKAREFVDRKGLNNPIIEKSLDLWERMLKAVDSGDFSAVEREIDWVIKYRLLERYQAQHNISLSHPRIAQLDLAYHDIRQGRGIFNLLEAKGSVARLTEESQVLAAKEIPPQTTRAKLRGDFIAAAQEKRRDYTVDWVHLKLNDRAQRTVLCKDPFKAKDDRVEKLIATM